MDAVGGLGTWAGRVPSLRPGCAVPVGVGGVEGQSIVGGVVAGRVIVHAPGDRWGSRRGSIDPQRAQWIPISRPYHLSDPYRPFITHPNDTGTDVEMDARTGGGAEGARGQQHEAAVASAKGASGSSFKGESGPSKQVRAGRSTPRCLFVCVHVGGRERVEA